jgi:HlyD family secretion protein
MGAIGALCCLVACGSPDRGAEAPSQTLEVVRGDVVERFLLTGELDALNSDALVTPQTPTWSLQVQWMAEDGVAVKAGDKVLEFDASALDTNLQEQKLEASQAASDLERQEADNTVTLAGKEFEVHKQRILVQKATVRAAVPEGALARREWQERQLELSRVQSALSTAEEGLSTQQRAARLEIEVREIALEKTLREIDAVSHAMTELTLTAPRDGIMLVAEHPWMGRKFDIGDEAWPGTTVVRLPDLSVMRVKATLPDVDDGSIAADMPVVCVLDAWPDREYPGRITSVGSVASKAGRNSLRRHFQVWVELEETDPAVMLPGMSVRVEVPARTAEQILVAPRASLDLSGEIPRAKRANGRWAEVEVGLCDNLGCEIRKGLDEGDRLQEVRGS